jgi:hypothetical protein
MRFADTSLESPEDICPPGNERELIDPDSYTASARSVVILVGREVSATSGASSAFST